MVTLVSFLGKGQHNSGYRDTDYIFDDGEVYAHQKYIGLALQKKLAADKVILLGTSSSMWDVFLEEGSDALEEQWFSLSDAVKTSSVTEELLQPFEKYLQQQLNVQVRCILIPFARTTQEQIEILSVLANALSEHEDIILDVTHGFRHLPMLSLVAARFLKVLKFVHVQHIYYGALDMTSAEGTPVLKLDGLLNLLDWIDALGKFDKDGDYGEFTQLLVQEGLAQSNAEQLRQAAFFERTSNSSKAKEKLSTLFTKLEPINTPIFNLFKPQLIKRLTWYKEKNRGLREQKLAHEYFRRHDYLRAVIYAMEGMISQYLYEQKEDEHKFPLRENAKKELARKESFRKLTILRNALAHGVKPEDQQNDILASLGDEQKMQQSLRDRFKHLLK
ncbi:TIGR02221 family CRISPR-associated protein [Acinetobacter modestus]|uniref:TIGR02221 family CRISPR-associated protein n=1 Tax=Acinetobacter modestus TaxID=1776740 RepID=UPI00202F0FD0|nr:TIGR02221 family CRISPR-associated protein [Acinetobacter modestus]MCM1960673.1 TIGR02221 family CRISPR-associated protein [Acinetobacter modestus]